MMRNSTTFDLSLLRRRSHAKNAKRDIKKLLARNYSRSKMLLLKRIKKGKKVSKC